MNISTLVSVAVLALSSAGASPLAYVPNEKSGTVSVIDTTTDTVVREIAAGKRPRGIASDSAGRTLFVTDAGSNTLLVLDAAGGQAGPSLALGKSPEGVHASADGRYVAFAVEESNSVTLIDAQTRRRLADIKVEGKNPEHAVFSPDGRWLLVSAEEAEQVDVIDVALRRQVGSIAVGLRPRGIGFSFFKKEDDMNLADISKMGVANPFKQRYDNYIGGKFVAPVKGEYFGNITPITGQVFCEIARSSAEDIELALDAAHAAKDAWGKTSQADRANILNKIADRMEANLVTIAVVHCRLSPGGPLTAAL